QPGHLLAMTPLEVSDELLVTERQPDLVLSGQERLPLERVDREAVRFMTCTSPPRRATSRSRPSGRCPWATAWAPRGSRSPSPSGAGGLAPWRGWPPPCTRRDG